MEKRAIFGGKVLPYLLLAPQLLITIVFFYWPANQALWQSFLLQDAFGLRTDFVWLENYRYLLGQGDYYRAMATTLVFSLAVTLLSLSIALLLAVQADKQYQRCVGLQDPPDLALRGRRRPLPACCGYSCFSPRWG